MSSVADPNLNALIAELSSQGLVVVDDVLTPNEVVKARDALARIHSREPDRSLDAPGYSIEKGSAGSPIYSLPDGSRFATNLFSKEVFFTGLMHKEPVISLVKSLMADPLLSSMNTLEPVRGVGHQRLHRDEGFVGSDGINTVNTLWVLDDMDRDNGATRYIPGTHLTNEMSTDEDPRLTYASVRSGSVIVMNAHMLHGASLNHDGRRRRVIHVYYTRQGRHTQTDWSIYVPRDVKSSLTVEQQNILGIS